MIFQCEHWCRVYVCSNLASVCLHRVGFSSRAVRLLDRFHSSVAMREQVLEELLVAFLGIIMAAVSACYWALDNLFYPNGNFEFKIEFFH